MSSVIEYQKKIRTPEEALRCVQSGMRVYIQPGCAEPETLVEALMQRGPHVEDVEIVHMMTMGKAPYVAPEMAGHFRVFRDPAELVAGNYPRTIPCDSGSARAGGCGRRRCRDTRWGAATGRVARV